MQIRSPQFKGNVREALDDVQLQRALGNVRGGFIDKRARAIDALRILDPFADTHPRIDGELRVGGWAVAWRELAAAVDAGRSVLAKSDGAVRLMAADEFLDAVHRVQTDADQRAPDPLAA